MRAKRGHEGKIGINVMWKCALTVLPTIYGAMLAGVDAFLCGAGVPMELPDIVRRMRAGEELEYSPLTGTNTHVALEIAPDDTASLLQSKPAPHMMPILSNFAFAKRLLDVWNKEYDGARPFAFVLENYTAGGHNAPPRNKSDFTEQDDIDSYFDKVQALGVPVYVAGDFPNGGNREDFEAWRARGAYGLQVGSRFALCSDSGMRDDLRAQIIERNRNGTLQVQTSPQFSPTGYPIKYVPLQGTLSERENYEARRRICNRKYLTHSHFETQPDGMIKETYICSAMPPEEYERLGGDARDTDNRVCLCNALLSTAGFYTDDESPMVTLGVSGERVKEHLSARQVVQDILGAEYVELAESQLAGSHIVAM
jgi:NAD(P)H-dependent flavin oxidoreductase YrpB (nitropropane dioxygenase family)